MTLLELLDLERPGEDRFAGVSPDDGWKRIYGGLVVSQALVAAYATIEGRVCHSLHSYFLRPGDTTLPVDYAVERIRDGASFATRRVVASQRDKPIFSMMASFQTPEDGFAHQAPMPPAPPPENLVDEMQRWLALGDAAPAAARRLASAPQRIQVRWVDPPAFRSTGAPLEPRKAVWIRVAEPIPDDIVLQQAALAYASDMTLIETAMRAHGFGFWSEGLQTASLDHSIWFHRPADFGQWHLFAQESPSSGGARGLALGHMFARDGGIVATVAQEGLMRLRPAAPTHI